MAALGTRAKNILSPLEALPLSDSLGLDSAALDASEDGNVVAGIAGSSAFRWTESAGTELLPSVSGVTLSDDGALLSGTSGNGAFVWNGSEAPRHPPRSGELFFESTIKLGASADHRRLLLQPRGVFTVTTFLLWDLSADSLRELWLQPETLSANGRVLAGSADCDTRTVALRVELP